MIKMAEPRISREEIDSVVRVLESGNLASGIYVQDFQNTFANFMNVKHTCATNSGTAALHTALLAIGVEPGDEVIVPAFSFFSTASMVNACGATPVFVDVQYNGAIDAECVEAAIGPKTSAIIAVNLYGRVDTITMEKLGKIVNNYNLPFIVDSCQCPIPAGAKYGDISCFSFYATKNITTGEGGMITTNDSTLINRCRAGINHGQFGSEKYVHRSIGYNYRMTDIAAAIGLGQISRLESTNHRRKQVDKLYYKLLKKHSKVALPDRIEYDAHHQYVIRVNKDRRDELRKHLLDNNIETAVHYPIPIPFQPAYRQFNNRKQFPHASWLSETVLSLPCHQDLTDEDVKFVAEHVNTFFEEHV